MQGDGKTNIQRMNRWCSVLAALWLYPCAFTVAASDAELLEAAKVQDWETVRSLLGQVNVNARQADGSTTLTWAAHWDAGEVAQQLLKSGADPDLGNDYGVTPLFLAIKNSSEPMVRLLLEGGADPDVSLWSGETPLMTAAKSGDVEVVRLLLDRGVNVDAREPRRGQSALMWAISFRHPDVARVLIEQGADVEARTTMLTEELQPMVLDGFAKNVDVTPRGGYTPLMFGARVGDLETTRLLIERGAEVNSVDHEHGPPLVIAAAEGYEELALYLLEQGADPNLTDGNGMTALHYAMRDGLKSLHGYGYKSRSATVVGRDKDVVLPGGNMYELAEALLARGANPNAAIKFPPPVLRARPARKPLFYLIGATPFLLATATQDVTAMKILLEEGAAPLQGTDIDQVALQHEIKRHGSENQYLGNATPLMVAVGMGRRTDQKFSSEQEHQALEAASLLVNLGADVNAASASGWTPLHAAAFIGADTLVRLLVEKGASVNSINGCGQTPLSLALRTSTVGLTENPKTEDIRDSTAKLLVTLGADDKAASEPVGQCILGRAGLEVELQLQKKVQQVKQNKSAN